MTLDASHRLKKKIPEIMKLWECRANEEVKGAHHQESLALRDSLPDYLRHLVDALSNSIERTEKRKSADKVKSTRLGKKHGADRAKVLHYTINQLISEYHILRQVIFQVLDKEKPMNQVEREVVLSSIEQAVNDAATEFSDRLKDLKVQMTQILAHDLRNPLTTAKISAQLIKRKPDDEKYTTEKSHLIITSLDRIDKMITDLLDASRAEAGEGDELVLKDCDLDWIIREVANESNIAQEGRFIVRSMGQCIGNWNADGLRRIVENLISNAVKYGQVGALISLTLEQDENYAMLNVNNKGEVIPEEERNIIFHKFKRAKSSENEIGWGLGLAGVQAMVDQHEGTIRVDSDEVNGTTFIMTIPKMTKEKPEAPEHRLPKHVDEKSVPQSKHH